MLGDNDHATAVEKARLLRRTMTSEERTLWEALRSRKLDGVKFRRQHPLGQFIVDFYAPSHRLAIEVDGPIHRDRADYDLRRQRFLETQGVKFLRFTSDEVANGLEKCLPRIKLALRQIESSGRAPLP
jgi:very-short-patch-repair endonuclease